MSASRLSRALRHPLTLVAGLALGTLAGVAAARTGTALPAWLPAAGGAYLALLNLVAVPLVWLALALNMVRLRAAPGAAARVGALACAAVVAVAACAVLGLGVARGLGAGQGVSAEDRVALGRLALASEPAEVVLLGGAEADVGRLAGDGGAEPGRRTDDTAASPVAPVAGLSAVHGVSGVPGVSGISGVSGVPGVPGVDAFLQALFAAGLPAALVAALVLGTALAAVPAGAARPAEAAALGLQRVLEVLADQLHALLPFFAFALAAVLAGAAWGPWAGVLLGFLRPFLAAAGLAAVLALAVIAWRARTHPGRVLLDLREALALAAWPEAPLAAVPALVQGLAGRLGLRRDLVELAAPLAPVFARAGDAVFFGALAVFAAHLHGRTLDGMDLALVASGAMVAALGATGGALVAAGAVLAWLGLPLAPLLPAFVLVEVLCAGPRQVVSLLVAGALVALVAPVRARTAARSTAARPAAASSAPAAAAAPAQPDPRRAPVAEPAARDARAAREAREARPTPPDTRFHFVVSGLQVPLLAGLLVLALLASGLAGVGVGLRQPAATPAPTAPAAAPMPAPAPAEPAPAEPVRTS